MTISPTGSTAPQSTPASPHPSQAPANANPNAATAPNAPGAGGTSGNYALNLPFSKAVGGGSIDSNPAVTLALLTAGQQQAKFAGAQILAVRGMMATVIGMFGGNQQQQARLGAENTQLQQDVADATDALTRPGGANDQLAGAQDTLATAKNQLATDTANHEPQPVLDADQKAVDDAQKVVDQDTATVNGLKATIDGGNARIASNRTQITNLQNVLASGFTKAVTDIVGKLAAAQRDALQFDQVQTALLANVEAGLRAFLGEAQRRKVERKQGQDAAETDYIDGRAEQHDEFAVISAEDLLRRQQAARQEVSSRDEGARNQADDAQSDFPGEESGVRSLASIDRSPEQAVPEHLPRDLTGALPESSAASTNTIAARDAASASQDSRYDASYDASRNASRNTEDAAAVAQNDGARIDGDNVAGLVQKARELLAQVDEALHELGIEPPPLSFGGSVSLASLGPSPVDGTGRLKLLV
jgi:hypothetical protein